MKSWELWVIWLRKVLMGKEYSFSADIWGIGVITYLLLTGYLPFDDEEEDK